MLENNTKTTSHADEMSNASYVGVFCLKRLVIKSAHHDCCLLLRVPPATPETQWDGSRERHFLCQHWETHNATQANPCSFTHRKFHGVFFHFLQEPQKLYYAIGRKQVFLNALGHSDSRHFLQVKLLCSPRKHTRLILSKVTKKEEKERKASKQDILHRICNLNIYIFSTFNPINNDFLEYRNCLQQPCGVLFVLKTKTCKFKFTIYLYCT